MNKRLINSDHSVLKVLSNHVIDYPTPININYVWSFGSLAGIFFGLQLATGIFLAMHYTPNVELAFASVEHIMRDVKNGWLLRYMHSNGASMVFIMIYVHIGKALYYRSYTHKRKHLFFSGVLIFLLMMGTAFIGYVLPWGQMSFWGATVITNLITAVPFVGESIAQWVWGGFSVGNPTLTRFYSLHYLLPFIITAIIFLHLVLLHTAGSSNPLGVNSSQDKISFYPYFFLKDAVGLALALLFYVILIHFYPNLLGHSDNYIQANPLVTPTHIVPEWYFLPFYAILRAIPNKIGGVVAMVGAILILLVIPFVDRSPIRTPRVRPIFNFFFWLFVADFFLLGFLGGHPAEEPYITASRLASVFYFSFFIIILPLTSVLEEVIAEEMRKEHQEELEELELEELIAEERREEYLEDLEIQAAFEERYNFWTAEARRLSWEKSQDAIQKDLDDLEHGFTDTRPGKGRSRFHTFAFLLLPVLTSHCGFHDYSQGVHVEQMIPTSEINELGHEEAYRKQKALWDEKYAPEAPHYDSPNTSAGVGSFIDRWLPRLTITIMIATLMNPATATQYFIGKVFGICFLPTLLATGIWEKDRPDTANPILAVISTLLWYYNDVDFPGTPKADTVPLTESPNISNVQDAESDSSNTSSTDDTNKNKLWRTSKLWLFRGVKIYLFLEAINFLFGLG